MSLRICEIVSKELRTLYTYNLRHAVLVIVFIIQMDKLICSECTDSRMCSSSILNKIHNPTPPVLPKPITYEQPTTIPIQEYYDVENTGRNVLTENYKSILNNQDAVTKKENTLRNPTANVDTEFLTEFSTTHNPVVNGGYESSEFVMIQEPIVNWDTELPSTFDTAMNNTTVNHINKIHLINEPREVNRSHESKLTSNGYPYSLKDEIKYSYLNITNIIGYLTGDLSNYASHLTIDDLLNLVGENAHCTGGDLSGSFECLQEKLLEFVRDLTNQKSLKVSDTVRLNRVPVTETR